MTRGAAQTTLRALLSKLAQIEAIEKHQRDRFPEVLEYELSRAGRELLFVANSLEGWLDQAPDHPLEPESSAAKTATKALTEGWSSTIVRSLASGPLSLTQLNRLIGLLSYPTLERRLAAMRLSGLVEAQPVNGRGKPYTVTQWLRRGIAPLLVAARWERRNLPQQTPPVGRVDIEAALLLITPLLRVPAELSGYCRLTAEFPSVGGPRPAGVTVTVSGGRITSCATHLEAEVDAWAHGSPAAWLNALIDGDLDDLEFGGKQPLPHVLLDRLHHTLFESQQKTT